MSEPNSRPEEQTSPADRNLTPAEREHAAPKPVHTGRHARVRQRLGRRR